jgi:hypothetical protein
MIGQFTFYEADGEWVIAGETTVVAVLKHSNRIEAEAVCNGLVAAYRSGRREKARDIQKALSGE